MNSQTAESNVSISVSAKWKGTCSKCKKSFIVGQTIYKIEEDYWCPDSQCKGAIPKAETPHLENLPEYQKICKEIWEFSKNEASKEESMDRIGRTILSQVFFKSNMFLFAELQKKQ